MTKEDKRNLLRTLLAERPHGSGPAKLAKWIPSSASSIYLWLKPGGPWPLEDKEARMWDFFDYTLDERGNPSPKKGVRKESTPPTLSAAQEEDRRQEIRREEDRLRNVVPPDVQERIRSLVTLHAHLQQATTSVEDELSTLQQTPGGVGTTRENARATARKRDHAK